MAKKKTAKKKKNSKPVKSRFITREMYLQYLIDVSERQIVGNGGGLDVFFRQQADRLKKELKAYKAK